MQTTLTPFDIDLQADADLPLVEGGLYPMSLAQRQLVHDFIEVEFHGDTQAAIAKLTARQSQAQLKNYELTVKNAASAWAQAKAANDPATARQKQAARYFRSVLDDPVKAGVDAPAVLAIRGLDSDERQMLRTHATRIALGGTQGQYNDFRAMILEIAPTLIERNREASEHDAVFADTDPNALAAPSGNTPPPAGDEEPF